MASATSHYRFSLGSFRSQPSYIVQSKKGIDCYNIPPELNEVLQATSHPDILDCCLGTDGLFFVQYKLNGVPTTRTSDELNTDLGLSSEDAIKRLVMGGSSTFWTVCRTEDRKLEVSWDLGNPSNEAIFRRLSSSQPLGDIIFVALGPQGSFIYATKSDMKWNGLDSTLMAVIQQARVRSKRISNVVMCPNRRDRWYIEFEDGTVRYQLPGLDENKISSYMVTGYSLQKPTQGGPGGRGPNITALESSSSLTLLDTDDMRHRAVSRLFYNGWKHDQKAMPVIRDVYAVEMTPLAMRAFKLYRASFTQKAVQGARKPTEKLLFHGTSRQCRLGDTAQKVEYCGKPDCSLCCILQESFKIVRAGTTAQRNFLRFGYGTYVTSVSSKADDYSKNHPKAPPSSLKVVIACNVILGKGFLVYRTLQELRSPPTGYDSVIGEIGEDLNYDEQVVYRDDAIRPAYLITYQP